MESWQMSSIDVARGVRARAFSAQEATRSVLQRVTEVDPGVNASAEAFLTAGEVIGARSRMTAPVDPADGWSAEEAGPRKEHHGQLHRPCGRATVTAAIGTVPLGSSPLSVSAFVFGAGGIGGVGSSPATRGFGLSPEDGSDRLGEAAALGVTTIDTADSYGDGASEATVGRWVRDAADERTVIMTKAGITYDGGTPPTNLSAEYLRQQCAQSVERLGRVDVFLAHAPDPRTPWPETVQALSDLQGEGVISAWGVCNVGLEALSTILRAADERGRTRPAVVQNRFNLLDRHGETTVLPLLMSEGIAFTPFSPLAGGILSERYLDGAVPQPGSRLAATEQVYYRGFRSKANLERIEELRELGRDREASVSGLALAWLRQHPAVTAPIVSPRSPDQWEAVTEAAALRLGQDDWDTVSRLFAPDGFQ
ncbi:aldo/keto reductase [Streptomyces sp. NEAU-W12]|uniref:aldo/keto reductase n=1 Tax=Streptomyces sp. NEAU-W12 TaxID=2994668 RepID=UPI00224B8FF5|nr:aldo/keto reductase [Streptomyces sp. NEAU-W12]MCX2924635.1 aldo/keto reductase [Streptomyces sp. NEAU-W12]